MTDNREDRLSIRTSPHVERKGDRDAINIKILPKLIAANQEIVVDIVP